MKPSKGTDKKRVIVDYKNVTPNILAMFTDLYPYGYEDDVIKFKNAKGEMVTAVPVETEDTKYLIKVGVEMDAKIEAFLDDDDDDSDDNVISDDSNLEAPSEEDDD